MPQQSNLQEQAIQALSLLSPEDQAKVVEYIQALADSQSNE